MYTLRQLHRVLQIVFSRLDYHLYEFRVAEGEPNERRFQEPDPESEDEMEDATAITLADLELAAGSRLVYAYDFGDDSMTSSLNA